jgi:hypothetical protein
MTTRVGLRKHGSNTKALLVLGNERFNTYPSTKTSGIRKPSALLNFLYPI